MHRRDFLLTLGITLVSASAYSFGKSIQKNIQKSDNIALVYGTRYGATEDTAKWIAKGMASSVDILNIENINFEETVKKYDKFVIGSGIWIDGAHKRLMELLSIHTEEGYFERFHKPLRVKPEVKRHFGGRMVIEKLSEKDRKLLDNFYRNVLKKEFVSWDRTKPEESEKFGNELLALCKAYSS